MDGNGWRQALQRARTETLVCKGDSLACKPDSATQACEHCSAAAEPVDGGALCAVRLHPCLRRARRALSGRVPPCEPKQQLLQRRHALWLLLLLSCAANLPSSTRELQFSHISNPELVEHVLCRHLHQAKHASLRNKNRKRSLEPFRAKVLCNEAAHHEGRHASRWSTAGALLPRPIILQKDASSLAVILAVVAIVAIVTVAIVAIVTVTVAVATRAIFGATVHSLGGSARWRPLPPPLGLLLHLGFFLPALQQAHHSDPDERGHVAQHSHAVQHAQHASALPQHLAHLIQHERWIDAAYRLAI